VPRVKYAKGYQPTNSFSMSYVSRKVIFPGVCGDVWRCTDIKNYIYAGLVQYDCHISINVHCSKCEINVESM